MVDKFTDVCSPAPRPTSGADGPLNMDARAKTDPFGPREQQQLQEQDQAASQPGADPEAEPGPSGPAGRAASYPAIQPVPVLA